eukprot:m.272522 g.272522  ORF g.272522 m.272522 type:complete len:59 (+) comp19332_c1_seq3:378-554(+)
MMRNSLLSEPEESHEHHSVSSTGFTFMGDTDTGASRADTDTGATPLGHTHVHASQHHA